MPITSEPTPNRPPAGIVHAIVKGNCGDSTWANGFWLLTTGVPGGTDLADLATDIYGAYETRFLPNFSDDCHMTECTVEYFTSDGSIPAAAFADHAGANSHFTSSASVAAVISWGIEPVYRGGKPRTYLPSVPQDKRATARTLQDDFVSSLTTGAAGFLGDVNGLAPGSIETVTLGVVHFFSAGVALDPPTFDPFVSASCQKRICSQRRRLGPEI